MQGSESSEKLECLSCTFILFFQSLIHLDQYLNSCFFPTWLSIFPSPLIGGGINTFKMPLALMFYNLFFLRISQIFLIFFL